MSESTDAKASLHLEVIRRTSELLMAALALVAALAWNEAIQALFLRLFGPASTLIAKFMYAILLTVLIVWVSARVAKLTSRLEQKLT